MPEKKLKTIDASETENRAVLNFNIPKGQPALKGGGNWNYLCGDCDTIIGEQVPATMPFVVDNNQPVVIPCNACGSYNEIPLANL